MDELKYNSEGYYPRAYPVRYSEMPLLRQKPVRKYCESPQQGQKDTLLLLLQEYGYADWSRVYFPAEYRADGDEPYGSVNYLRYGQ